MPDRLGVCLQLDRLAASQYAGWNFNSMCKFGDKYLGADENGVFTLDEGDYDNSELIPAFFELLTSDYGTRNPKKIRSMYFGYESDGNLLLTVKTDDGDERVYNLNPNQIPDKQHSVKVSIGRDGKGRYFMVRIDNVDGADFSVDRISMVPITVA